MYFPVELRPGMPRRVPTFLEGSANGRKDMTLRTTESAGRGYLDGARDSSRPPYELASTDNLDVLLAVLPPRISDAVANAGRRRKATTISSRS